MISRSVRKKNITPITVNPGYATVSTAAIRRFKAGLTWPIAHWYLSSVPYELLASKDAVIMYQMSFWVHDSELGTVALHTTNMKSRSYDLGVLN